MVVSTETNPALLPVGYISDQIIGGTTFATVELTCYHDLPDLISVSTYMDHHARMQEYDSNCTSCMNWFVLAGTCYSLSEPEPHNSFESMEGLLNTAVDGLVLRADFWAQSDVPCPWNHHWTEGAPYGGVVELDDLVFGNGWNKNWGAHAWFNYNP